MKEHSKEKTRSYFLVATAEINDPYEVPQSAPSCGEAEARIGTISPLDENSRKFQCWHRWFHSHTVRKYNSRWVLSKTGPSVQGWSRRDCVQERALMSLGLVWGNVVSRRHGCRMKNVKIAGAALGFQKLSQGPVGRSARWRERQKNSVQVKILSTGLTSIVFYTLCLTQ